jgi:hypothetical protein
MFQFPSFTTATYEFSDGRLGMTPGRFPDSEISGSQPA